MTEDTPWGEFVGIRASSNFIHWNYYLALEQDLAHLARYVEFSSANFRVYSIELAHLLLAAAAEVDVVMKGLCELLEPTAPRKNIEDYKSIVKRRCSALIQEECRAPRYQLTLRPWSNWKGKAKTNPLWWRGYNNVKHHRASHYPEANLKNALNALAALNVTVVYF